MKRRIRRIAFAGVIGALYTALTLATASLAYGPVQFRIAEALTVLCCFTPAAIPGMVIGCMTANLASFVSGWDFVIGSAATLLACLLTWRISGALRRENADGRGAESPEEGRGARLRRLLPVFLIPLPTILCNAAIVGAEIAFFFDDRAFLPAWGMNALTVGLGELVVMYLLGVPLLLLLLKDRVISRRLREI